MKRKNALQAALQGKCPRCRKGDMFVSPVFKLKSFGKTHEYCPVCKVQFEQEPGFFYGAMYVSYALSVGIFLASVFVLYVFFNDPKLEVYVTTVTVVALMLYPIIFRCSRVLYLYLFGGISYDPDRVSGLNE